MRIDILNLQDKIGVDEKKIKKISRSALEGMGEDEAELSLLLVDDSYIRKLNKKYRGSDYKTDVLAFAMRDGEGVPPDSPILGDVVISVETAKREAINRKRKFDEEMNLYIVHGILHLLGYEDETAEKKKTMESKEKELLERI